MITARSLFKPLSVSGSRGSFCKRWNAVTETFQRLTSSQAASCAILEQELVNIREAGTFKSERVITSKQGPSIHVQGSQGDILNFCANNYLGLSSHPAVIEAGKKALDTHGAGLSSVRFICGTQDIHKALEEKIAKFHGKDDAILYISCFDANAGIFEVLLSPDDAVISDELNHASIIDGIRLCKAQRYRYKHRDMKDLESHLISTKDCRQRLIVTDGVFSMDGNVAPLKDICDLGEKHNAMVFIDECHATGFFGATGRGTEEYFNLDGKVDIINSTLGKAIGGAAGGYTAGPQPLIDLLRQRSRPYLFSNTLPPPVVACASKAFDLVMENADLPKKVLSNTTRFRSRMKDAGFTLSGDEEHPICPVMLGDAKLASSFADMMLERGIYVIGFSYPVVPKGKARIRVQISASHSEQDIDTAVDAFINIGRQLKAFDLVMENADLPKKVLSNTTRFRSRMKDAGFTLSGDEEHPICPVMLGDAKLASSFADMMLERGIYVIGFSYPVVPKGKARIRVQISASHSEQDIDTAVDAFINIGRQLKVVA